MPLAKIYRHQRVPFLALVLVVTCVRSSTLPHLFPDLNPISLFGTILHYTYTPSNIIYCISCSKCRKLYIGETGRRLSDRFAEHLRSVRNNDVDKPVARDFNTANHSISDIKVCAISSIFGGNDSRKRQEKCLIYKTGGIHPHGLNERFSFIWSLRTLHSFCFCTACADKSGDFSPYHSIVYVHPLPTCLLRASASFTNRL